jgi:protein farnesyltransferase/geranylgeranyltransferase type-1 subunit alpha
MAASEHSPRCLRLTEHVISMNPAHYTVWLYRFRIAAALEIPLTDELAWLNDVALGHLKNYQIWHHRQLLVEHHVAALKGKDGGGEDQLARLAESESAFLAEILSHDTKNYHVWSYRQWLVRKLALFNAAELADTASLIAADVRNNSAWSHRFFLVFSDPAASTPGAPASEPDPRVPPEVVDREVAFALEAIRKAPQNQSAWNYLRGALAKGSRPLASVEGFCRELVDVERLGRDGQEEKVRSTHALDCLAEIFAMRGDRQMAGLALDRLAERWDPIRTGYWQYRKSLLQDPKEA